MNNDQLPLDPKGLTLDQQKLKENEFRFRSLIEEYPVASCLFVGRDLIIQEVNSLMIALFGKGDTILGKPLAQVLPELEEQGFLQILDTVYTTGEIYQDTNAKCDLVIDGQFGTYYFDFTYKPLRNTAGEIYAILETSVDVTGQVVARQKLAESESRFRRLVEQTPTAMLVVKGEELLIETINQAMLTIMGRGKDIINKPLEIAMPELIGQPLVAHCRQVLHTGTPYYGWGDEAQVWRNGKLETGYYNVSCTPIYEGDHLVGVMQVAAEVTQQVAAQKAIAESENRYRNLSTQLEQQVLQRTYELGIATEELTAVNEEYVVTNQALEEANELLVRSNQSLQQFAYVASHDLQEPLRKVQQFGNLLRTQYGEQLGDGVNYLERMQVAASRMSTLIRDVLRFSHISSSKETSELTSLADVIETVLVDLELLIEETRASVYVDNLPTIRGDRSQLEQLFQNLLSNALKFRQVDTIPQIKICVQTLPEARLPPGVKPTRSAKFYHRIDVIDNGIGFDEKYADRIFRLFQRLHGKNQFSGTGIGLAICEKVTANHGGAITATSQPNEGATFNVYLPL
ncbi:ATP-binding protein [Spirosoma flavum]|uniref:histidine kinase n=1 Tax=Spirosoma flavum TaxID=2048557 RepID=A0ABW6AWA9_9BACT